MLAELLTKGAYRLLNGVGPDGASYWAERYWDRRPFQSHPVVGPHYRKQDDTIGEMIAESEGVESVIEVGPGVGVFTEKVCALTSPTRIHAIDISAHALDIVRERVRDPRLELVHGDFWKDNGVEPADLVVCVDSIHHLGSTPQVLRRLREYMKPGGRLIGNVWTLDNFHEFQRSRVGTWKHLRQTVDFAVSAALISGSRGKLRRSSYRTQLRKSSEIPALLEENIGTVEELHTHRYFTAFACRI